MTAVDTQRPADCRQHESTDELRICQTPLCTQVIARTNASGGFYPKVREDYIEGGSLVLVCPVCGKKHKFSLALILSQYRQALTAR